MQMQLHVQNKMARRSHGAVQTRNHLVPNRLKMQFDMALPRLIVAKHLHNMMGIQTQKHYLPK